VALLRPVEGDPGDGPLVLHDQVLGLHALILPFSDRAVEGASLDRKHQLSQLTQKMTQLTLDSCEAAGISKLNGVPAVAVGAGRRAGRRPGAGHAARLPRAPDAGRLPAPDGQAGPAPGGAVRGPPRPI